MRTLLFTLLISIGLHAQVYEFSTTAEDGTPLQHRILMDEHYIVETVFASTPAKFVKTLGGFYTKNGNTLVVAQLEFNSNYEKDGLKSNTWTPNAQWIKKSNAALDLNGKWLMAGRVTSEGERRRDLSGPRKTMKFLVDGHFQWIAFNTESLAFFGSGGGTYSATEGTYTEQIEYFSRDNSRVGMALSFQYDQKGKDWYHKGKSSKGDPMHEIWSSREH
jgi:hypothetical protein